MKLAEKIKELRLKKDWTKKELAENSGVSMPVITGLERGDYKASDLTIARLAKALECDFGELLSLKDK